MNTNVKTNPNASANQSPYGVPASASSPSSLLPATPQPKNPTNPTSQPIDIPEIPEIPDIPELLHRNNSLASLTPNQLAKLDQWIFGNLTIDQICQLCPHPEPAGLGLRLSRSVIGRYSEKRHLHRRLLQHRELSEAAQSDTQQTLPELLDRFARYALFNPAFDPAIFNSLVRFHRAQLQSQRDNAQQTARHRGLDLAAGRLHLEIFKAQYNAARLSLEHAAQLQTLLADPTKDDQAKIDQARQILFAQDAVPTPKNATNTQYSMLNTRHPTRP